MHKLIRFATGTVQLWGESNCHHMLLQTVEMHGNDGEGISAVAWDRHDPLRFCVACRGAHTQTHTQRERKHTHIDTHSEIQTDINTYTSECTRSGVVGTAMRLVRALDTRRRLAMIGLLCR
jgi:hypothetical protein